jgi:hypothetical protein
VLRQVARSFATPARDAWDAARLIPRLHTRRVWALWLVGALLLLCIAEFEPSVIAYLADPELLAGTVVVSALLLRRALMVAARLAARALDSFFWYQIRWPDLAAQYVRDRGRTGSLLAL